MLKLEIEGTDGSGKTTAIQYLKEKFQKLKVNFIETREVGNPNIEACVKLREFVLDPKNNLRGETMEMIFSAMRFENDRWYRHFQDPDNGFMVDFVLSDRGWFSHLSYTDHNVSEEFTEMLYDKMMKNVTLLPDIVIYFSVDTKTALARRIKRGGAMDAIELKGVEYQEKVRQSFEKHLAKYSDVVQIFTVDANQDVEGVRRQLDRILLQIFNTHKEFEWMFEVSEEEVNKIFNSELNLEKHPSKYPYKEVKEFNEVVSNRTQKLAHSDEVVPMPTVEEMNQLNKERSESVSDPIAMLAKIIVKSEINQLEEKK
jgi:dTMP kinase